MTEYIDREKLLALYVDGKYDTADYRVPVPVIIQNIKDIPAEDVQPVVRCRDCVHWAESQTSKDYGSCDCDALLRWEDFYCAAGRRKEQT